MALVKMLGEHEAGEASSGEWCRSQVQVQDPVNCASAIKRSREEAVCSDATRSAPTARLLPTLNYITIRAEPAL